MKILLPVYFSINLLKPTVTMDTFVAVAFIIYLGSHLAPRRFPTPTDSQIL